MRIAFEHSEKSIFDEFLRMVKNTLFVTREKNDHVNCS